MAVTCTCCSMSVDWWVRLRTHPDLPICHNCLAGLDGQRDGQLQLMTGTWLITGFEPIFKVANVCRVGAPGECCTPVRGGTLQPLRATGSSHAIAMTPPAAIDTTPRSDMSASLPSKLMLPEFCLVSFRVPGPDYPLGE